METTSAMSEAPPLPTPPAYRDRSAGLVIFGVLTLLFGLICALFVPFLLLGVFVHARTDSPAAPPAARLQALCIYGGMAALLITLGIGSIRKRRWARALLLVFSWSGLIIGGLMVGMMSFILPKAFAQLPANAAHGQPMPSGMMTGVLVFMLVFMTFFFVVLPLVWGLFYKSSNVKATCEASDPRPCWTDACPLPVLAVCVWQWLCTPFLLLMPFTVHGVIPFFGIFLSGVAGSAGCLLLGVVFFHAACRLYRLDPRGWWLMLAMLLLSTLSSVLTYARHDIVEMHQLMGYSSAQIALIQKNGLITGHHLFWFNILFMVPFLGYLLFIRRYMKTKTD